MGQGTKMPSYIQPEPSPHLIARVCGAATLLALMSMMIGGCAKHEKVLEVNTPGGAVEVDKTTHLNGDVDVRVKSEKHE